MSEQTSGVEIKVKTKDGVMRLQGETKAAIGQMIKDIFPGTGAACAFYVDNDRVEADTPVTEDMAGKTVKKTPLTKAQG
jgi:hypothetical protein